MPIVGDRVYGGRTRVPANLEESLREKIQQFPRQALHATRLTIEHPASGEIVSWQAAMPEDMQMLVDLLRASG